MTRSRVLSSRVSNMCLKSSNITEAKVDQKPATSDEVDARAYVKPFLEFMTENPTVFHAVDAFSKRLDDNGFTCLSERELWKLEAGGKYYVKRNGSALIAFAIGSEFKSGNGFGLVCGHVE